MSERKPTEGYGIGSSDGEQTIKGDALVDYKDQNYS